MVKRVYFCLGSYLSVSYTHLDVYKRQEMKSLENEYARQRDLLNQKKVSTEKVWGHVKNRK